MLTIFEIVMMVVGIYVIVYLAILVLGEIRLLGKQVKPVHDIESTTSFSTVEPSAKNPLLQLILFLVMAITVYLGILVRASIAGWLVIFFFIPDVILTTLHFFIQIRAILRISEMKPAYVPLILVSNMFFFLEFSLQVDAGDAPGTYVAFLYYFKHWALEEVPGDNLLGILLLTSIGFLGALIVSWFFLLGKSFLKQENIA